MELVDKVAFITGAGSGIGKATAIRLAKAGAKIGVHDRLEWKARATVEEITANGGEAHPVWSDVTEAENLRANVVEVHTHYGRLDVVFANAGINGVWAPLDELELDEFDKTIAVNLRGSFCTVKFAYPFLKDNGGSIIVCSSINGTRVFSNGGATAYSCTKGAQVVMARMLALELAKDKIRVNSVCPGWIETDIEQHTEERNIEKARVPMIFPEGEVPLKAGGPGDPEEVAEVVLFLASAASRHVTGTEIFVDGGESLMRG